MLDLMVPLKGGFVFSAQHFVLLVGGGWFRQLNY